MLSQESLDPSDVVVSRRLLGMGILFGKPDGGSLSFVPKLVQYNTVLVSCMKHLKMSSVFLSLVG